MTTSVYRSKILLDVLRQHAYRHPLQALGTVNDEPPEQWETHLGAYDKTSLLRSKSQHIAKAHQIVYLGNEPIVYTLNIDPSINLFEHDQVGTPFAGNTNASITIPLVYAGTHYVPDTPHTNCSMDYMSYFTGTLSMEQFDDSSLFDKSMGAQEVTFPVHFVYAVPMYTSAHEFINGPSENSRNKLYTISSTDRTVLAYKPTDGSTGMHKIPFERDDNDALRMDPHVGSYYVFQNVTVKNECWEGNTGFIQWNATEASHKHVQGFDANTLGGARGTEELLACVDDSTDTEEPQAAGHAYFRKVMNSDYTLEAMRSAPMYTMQPRAEPLSVPYFSQLSMASSAGADELLVLDQLMLAAASQTVETKDPTETDPKGFECVPLGERVPSLQDMPTIVVQASPKDWYVDMLETPETTHIKAAARLANSVAMHL